MHEFTYRQPPRGAKALRKNIRLVGHYFRVNLSAAMAYRESFLWQAFGMLVSNSTFLFFWWLLFTGRDTIAGYTFRDVMFVWGVGASSFGLGHIIFGNSSSISRLIISGELDTFLLQPPNILINTACARTNFSAWGDFAYGFVLMAVTGRSFVEWGCFIFALVCGAFIFCALSVAFHSLTFYLGDASMFASLSLELSINFMIYPEYIYSAFLRVLMYTLIPSGWVAHVPLRLSKGSNPLMIFAMIAVSIAACLISAYIFNRGLRKYESGNLIITRL